MKPILVVGGDNRLRNFQELADKERCDEFEEIYLAKPGAKARDIEDSFVGTLNKIDKNRLVLFELAVGVNNFMVKYKN